MLADGGRDLAAQGIQDANCISLAGELADRSRDPADCFCLVAGAQLTAGSLAMKYQGDNTATHVLVNTGKGDWLDVQAGFLANFSPETVVDGLV